MRQGIRSQRVVTPEGTRAATVVYESGKIIGIEETSPAGVEVLDIGPLVLLPGLVDSHVHINSPGRTEWEGFATASRAAAAGGYTCLVDMPLNSVPATTNVAALQEKLRAAENTCLVDHAFWGGAVSGNAADLPALAREGVAGFKAFLVHPGIEEFTMVSEAELRAAMPVIEQTGLPLLVHAEDPVVIRQAQTAATGDARNYQLYLQSRPDQAEVAAIEMMIRLCREFNCRVHIVHLATAAAVPSLRLARKEGLPLTVETCPHYLFFAAEDVPDGATQFKCAPPIRGKANRDALWTALREGDIDLIATDHSPCPPQLKRLEKGDFLQAWGGIASLSVALPAMWTAAQARGFDLSDISCWMSERPALLAGLHSRKGAIAVGRDADFVSFDPDEQFVVAESDLYFRHSVTPYLGQRLTGRVKMTWVRGTPVFDTGRFTGESPGRACLMSEVYSK